MITYLMIFNIFLTLYIHAFPDIKFKYYIYIIYYTYINYVFRFLYTFFYK